jgi:23S rRNA (uracil1939-C5)-methyltransferase
MDEEINVRIEKLSYGGHGVGRCPDGVVLFVPYTARGDLIRARITEDQGSFRRASVTEILEASPDRVEPKCPLFMNCGSCHLQHTGYDSQLEIKEEIFYEQLAKIGGIGRDEIEHPEGILASPSSFNYRIRARFQAGYRDGKILVGYHKRRSNEVIDIEECPLVSDCLGDSYRRLRDWFREKNPEGLTGLEVSTSPTDGSTVLFMNPRDEAPKRSKKLSRSLIEDLSHIVSVCVQGSRGAGGRQIFGDSCMSLKNSLPHREKPISLFVPPGGFVQANFEGNLLVLEKVEKMLSSTDLGDVLELYCGTGNFTFLLAGRSRSVTAVELDPNSIEAAERASYENGFANIMWVPSGAKEFLRRYDEERLGREFDLVFLNPPRSGAKEISLLLTGSSVRNVIYVSCNPSTLARDLKTFVSNGYVVERTFPVDLYPHSYHIESVTFLKKDS